MAEEYPRAISFVNSYFALVDGLAHGLEDHLSQTVILDWFGRTIRGKENVTAFLKAHKFASRHIFSDIKPSSSIGYRERRSIGKKTQTNKTASEDPDNNLGYKDSLYLGSENDPADLENNNNVDPKPEITSLQDADANLNDEDEKTYELDEDDLAALFRLDISSTRIEEIEESIEKIKQEETKMSIAKMECDDPVIVESISSVKYVETNGQIEFEKRSRKRGSETQKWKKSCKLQIAYTETERKNAEIQMDHPPSFAADRIRDNRRILPSLREMTELCNNLVPNINDFGGYLQNVDFDMERDVFLENFHAELSRKSAVLNSVSPRYVDDRLVFGKMGPRVKQEFRKDEKKDFVFNYEIHLIIYQGNAKRRRDSTKDVQK